MLSVCHFILLNKKLNMKFIKDSNTRQRIVLSIKDKAGIIIDMEKGKSVRLIQEKYKIGKSTIYDLVKNKNAILTRFNESDSKAGMAQRKTLRTAENPPVDKALYMWFKQQRCRGVPISGTMLIEKAKLFHKEMQIKTHCCYSNGWLQKFKNRYGIRQLKVSGEKLSADEVNAVLFVDELSSLITDRNLTPEQVYNADETGIFWKCLPRSTLAGSDESVASGSKESKERFTVLVCANAAGSHKCKLLVIGKSQKPRALKGMKVYPVIYKSNKRSWVTQSLFIDWFKNNFVKEARHHCNKVGLPLDCEIVLLLDNCPAHPDPSLLNCNNVSALYIPPNCTSLIQPMDQGVIRSVKCHYRKEMMKKQLNFEDQIENFSKNFTIKDFMWCIYRAWESVSPDVLKNTWHNIWPPDNDETETEEPDQKHQDAIIHEIVNYTAELNLSLNVTNLLEWIKCDNEAPVFGMLTDAEIISEVLNFNRSGENLEDGNETDDSEEDVCHQAKMSTNEAIQACSDLLNFMENQSYISTQEIMQLCAIQAKINANKPKLTQTVLQNYFKQI